MYASGPKIDFNTSSERPLSKLSENHKINVIGPTKLKLWPFKDALFNPLHFESTRVGSVTRVLMVQIH